MDWWKHDDYTRLPRVKRLRWLGMTIATRPYRRTILGDYWRPATDTVALIDDLITCGIVPPLNADSRIFEGGCSVGRNLYYLQERFGCHVTGLDISEGAVALREELWRDRPHHRFIKDNALTTSFFDECPDNAFDLVLTRGHLMHIPRSEAKARYVASLKRIGRTLAIIEPTRPGVNDVQLFQDGTYCLSFDDWEAEYHLRRHTSPAATAMGANTIVCYSSKL